MIFNHTALIILDGWGHGQDPKASAMAQANIPYVRNLYKQYPNSELVTYGEEVGLPDGQMGNSEVGHLNIGAGRIVYQELVRINKAVREKTLQQNAELLKAIQYAKTHNKAFHLMGLVSDGGVHSHINHLKALCDICVENGLTNVFIHAFTDGRDTDPKSGLGFLQELLAHIQNTPIQLATVIGRYYAMDRDKRWERIKLAYDALLFGQGLASKDILTTIQESYAQGVSDEFIKPIVLVDAQNQPIATIQEQDAVLCFNFRTDRCRQITTALTQQDFPDFGMKTIELYYCTTTRYDETYKNVHVLYEQEDLSNTLGEVLERAGKTQVRIAETEKYPHVSFFFSGQREQEFVGEKRIIVPSPKVATYDLQPEMSAKEVTEKIVTEIETHQPNFICLNYANADMVGHTGVFSAAVKAVETVDSCLQTLIPTLLKHNYAIIMIADHGNSDYLINPDGTPNTAHTKNPVPCFFIANDTANYHIKNGKLADVAPTLLYLMGIEKPAVMDGEVLLSV